MSLLRHVCFMLFVFTGIVGIAQHDYDQYFTAKTLRIDYLRSGNINTDSIAMKAMFIEGLWSGSRSGMIEPYDYGDYKIEVFTADRKQRLFNFSYSSLFSEYKFTEPGRTEIKSFQETVRIPFPKNPVLLIFYKRLYETNAWTKQFEIAVEPEKIPLTHSEVSLNANIKQLVYSGRPEEKVDIAILAEGYTSMQSEKFFEDAQRTANYLLNCEPFKFYREKFNIWAVFAASEQDGITDPSDNITKTTLLGSNFSTFGSDRYLMTENHFMLRDIASAVPYDHLIVLANIDKYGGGGIYNFYATCTADDPHADFLVVHEFGHSFAGLADEYWTSDVSVIDYYNTDVEPYEPNITTLVSFETKWKDMVDGDTPVPTPSTKTYKDKVGVFEGGGYLEKGIYRPFLDCTMKSVMYDAFCPVCKSAIEKTILHFSE